MAIVLFMQVLAMFTPYSSRWTRTGEGREGLTTQFHEREETAEKPCQ